MTVASCASLTKPLPLEAPAKPEKLSAPEKTPPESYLTLCDSALPTLPVPSEGETLSGDLVWNTVLVGWSSAYFQCALKQARIVGWHEGARSVELPVTDTIVSEQKEPKRWWKF